MTGVMGTTFGDPAPRRGVLAPPTADARVAQVEPDDDETDDEQVDSKPKRTRRQRPPATRSDR